MLIDTIEPLLTRCYKMAYDIPPLKYKVRNDSWWMKWFTFVASQNQEKTERSSFAIIHLHHDIFDKGAIPIHIT